MGQVEWAAVSLPFIFIQLDIFVISKFVDLFINL